MVPLLIGHAGEGRHPREERGWIPAFAGMTEESTQFVAQIVPVRVFSKESTHDIAVRSLTLTYIADLSKNPTPSAPPGVCHTPLPKMCADTLRFLRLLRVIIRIRKL